MSQKILDVIIPSFKDDRIIRTISSLKVNNFYSSMRLIIIDGDSGEEFINQLQKQIRADDILISERDKGIFDALNKGLDLATNEYIYWLGSDDFVSPSFDFEKSLENAAIGNDPGFVARTHYFNNKGVTRPLYYNRITLSDYKRGVHVPHFSSVWKREIIGELRFVLEYKIASDYDFFFRLLAKCQKVSVLNENLVYMQEGGNSSRGFRQRLKGTKELFNIHRSHTNTLSGIYFVFRRYYLKITLKIRKKDLSGVDIIEDLSAIINRLLMKN